MTNKISLLTFSGFIKGLSAAALESQYFDEYIKLSKFVNNVTIVSGEVSKVPSIPSNVEIYDAKISKIPKIRGISKIFKFIIFPFKLRKKINLIYVRTMSPPEILALRIAKKLLKIPCVLMIGGTCYYEPINFKNKIFRWNYSKALSSSDQIIVYSKRMIPYIKKLNVSIDDLKFSIVHNAVDETRFFSKEKDENLLRKLGITNNEKIILFIGKINIRKGVLDVLKTISLLHEQNVKVLFIGSYSKNSQDFKKIENEIKSANIFQKVIFVGEIPNDQLLNYYSCADVFVYLTKKCEGIPRAILESMACGKPVVSTNVAGIPDAVIDDITGYVVNSIDEASVKIDQLFSNKELYEKLSKNCRNKIIEEFVYDVTLPKMVNVFNSVLNGQKKI